MATRQTVTMRRTRTTVEPARKQGSRFQLGFGRSEEIYIRPHWIFTKRSSAIPMIGRRIG